MDIPKELTKLLSCSLCRCNYSLQNASRYPKELRCYHCFCAACVDLLNGCLEVVCPRCGLKTPLPPMGDLPTNEALMFVLKQLPALRLGMAMMQQQNEQQLQLQPPLLLDQGINPNSMAPYGNWLDEMNVDILLSHGMELCPIHVLSNTSWCVSCQRLMCLECSKDAEHKNHEMTHHLQLNELLRQLISNELDKVEQCTAHSSLLASADMTLLRRLIDACNTMQEHITDQMLTHGSTLRSIHMRDWWQSAKNEMQRKLGVEQTVGSLLCLLKTLHNQRCTFQEQLLETYYICRMRAGVRENGMEILDFGRLHHRLLTLRQQPCQLPPDNVEPPPAMLLTNYCIYAVWCEMQQTVLLDRPVEQQPQPQPLQQEMPLSVQQQEKQQDLEPIWQLMPQAIQQPAQQAVQQAVQQPLQPKMKRTSLRELKQSMQQPLQQKVKQPMPLEYKLPLPQDPAMQLQQPVMQQKLKQPMQPLTLEPAMQPKFKQPVQQKMKQQPMQQQPMQQNLPQPMLQQPMQQILQQPAMPPLDPSLFNNNNGPCYDFDCTCFNYTGPSSSTGNNYFSNPVTSLFDKSYYSNHIDKQLKKTKVDRRSLETHLTQVMQQRHELEQQKQREKEKSYVPIRRHSGTQTQRYVTFNLANNTTASTSSTSSTVAATAPTAPAASIFTAKAPPRKPARLTRQPRSSSYPVYYLDMEIEREPAGRILIEVRNDVAPLMAQNFRALILHERGYGYKGCDIFQAWANESVITGDFELNTGRGGYAALDDRFFMPDESGLVGRRGTVGMRRGQKRYDNCGFVGSQFRMVLNDNNTFTAIFGYIVSGIDVLDKIANTGNATGYPLLHTIIKNCGEYRRASF